MTFQCGVNTFLKALQHLKSNQWIKSRIIKHYTHPPTIDLQFNLISNSYNFAFLSKADFFNYLWARNGCWENETANNYIQPTGPEENASSICCKVCNLSSDLTRHENASEIATYYNRLFKCQICDGSTREKQICWVIYTEMYMQYKYFN